MAIFLKWARAILSFISAGFTLWEMGRKAASA
jgi:hypothetical protein